MINDVKSVNCENMKHFILIYFRMFSAGMYMYFSICSLLLEGSPAVFIPFFLLVSSVRLESNGHIIFLQNIRGEIYFCGIQRSCITHVLYPLVIITALWEVSATGMVKLDVTFSGFLGH